MVSSAEVLTTAGATQTTMTTDTKQVTSRQPPTVADMTAAAFRSPKCNFAVVDFLKKLHKVVNFDRQTTRNQQI